MYRSRRPIGVAPSRYPTLLSPTTAVVSPVYGSHYGDLSGSMRGEAPWAFGSRSEISTVGLAIRSIVVYSSLKPPSHDGSGDMVQMASLGAPNWLAQRGFLLRNSAWNHVC